MRSHLPVRLVVLVLVFTAGTVLLPGVFERASAQSQTYQQAGTPITSFQHVIVVIQENRSPDNFFQGLCVPPFGGTNSCSSKPTRSQYNILTSNWQDKNSPTGYTQPVAIPFSEGFDLNHSHQAFLSMYHNGKMDGAGDIACRGTCIVAPQFTFVDNTQHSLDPYLELATQYGWANYMFQTNQGPSFPAHQFLFGGTSAPSASDDAAGIYASENATPVGARSGCIALATTMIALLDVTGEHQSIFPCFERQTLSDLLEAAAVSWKYYTPGVGLDWTAPNAIQHICQPDAPSGGNCVGPDFLNYVDLHPSDVLTDIGNCTLAAVSWVVPSGSNSDHSGNVDNVGGPSWVASIVNTLGNNPRCTNGEIYWKNTAIILTWDDWGGWYDHELPTILPLPQGDYQNGFRVPLIFVSAYTQPGLIDNQRHDFGSVLRFIEHNFGITEGALNFADARAATDLTSFYHLNRLPRHFVTITAPKGAEYFIHDKTPLTDPDDD
jgi:phospholipase C